MVSSVGMASGGWLTAAIGTVADELPLAGTGSTMPGGAVTVATLTMLPVAVGATVACTV